MKTFFILLIVVIASTVNYAMAQITPPGAALRFDGIDDYVRVPSGGGLNNLQSGTIEMWVKWIGDTQDGADGSLPNYGPVLSRQSNDEFSNQIISLDGENPVTAKIVWKPYNAYSNAIRGNTSPGNRWNHIAIVYSSGDHKLYLNGVLDGSSTETGVMGNNSNVALGIGGWIGEGVRYGNADIDEVRIWNVMKTEDEIRASMNCELPSGTPGLLANYHFNQGMASADNTGEITLNDFSGNANNGTLNNFALNGSSSNWIAAGGVVSGTNCPPCPVWYLDEDGDQYYSGSPIAACTSPGAGYTTLAIPGGDCADNNNSVHPGASEICSNGIDDNCNGQIDEGCAITWYRDSDGDNYGNPKVTKDAMTQPAGYILRAMDCKDNDRMVFPGASELCDGKDNDCNGLKDDGAPGSVTWYRDADNDGYGNAANTKVACLKPKGFILVAGDCRDTDPTIYPGATEICDGKDNDCNGLKDDGAPGSVTWYRDADNDGYGNAANTKVACLKPKGFILVAGDCKDTDPAIYPGASEICDGKDNDCDGIKDEGCVPPIAGSSYPSIKAAKPGINPESEVLEVTLWPNPAKDVVIVSLNAFEAGKKVEMILMQVDGRQLSSKSIVPDAKGQQVKFDVRTVSAGYYLLQVNQGGLSETKRIVIIK